MIRSLLALVLVAAVGCGDGADTAPTGNNGEPDDSEGPAVTYHRDIAPLIEANCGECHREGGIAPFTMADYAEVDALKMSIKESVHNRTMPPWLAGPDCTTYVNDPSLNDAQLALIDEWIELGAPEGDPSDAPPASEETQENGLSRVDMTISMPELYAPQFEPDDYRCFVIEWPEDTTKYVTGFRAIPGNDAIVHHVIAYLGTPDQADTFRGLDEAEAGPGYTCYGGAGARSNWLGSWAPGSNQGDFWPSTGVKIEPGSVIVMQIHYNTLNSGALEDLTSIDLRLEDSVEKEAFVMPFTNPSWLDPGGMPIPKDDPEATHAFAFDPSSFLSYITDGAVANGEFVIYGLGIHMHSLGSKGTIAIERAGGDTECMLDVPRWDFDWQLAYGFLQPKVFRPGDKLSLKCQWDNSAGNQIYAHVDTDGDGTTDAYQQLEPGDVEWGEGTQDEMCLGVMYVTAP